MLKIQVQQKAQWMVRVVNTYGEGVPKAGARPVCLWSCPVLRAQGVGRSGASVPPQRLNLQRRPGQLLLH